MTKIFYGFDLNNIRILEKTNEEEEQRFSVTQQDGSVFEFTLSSLEERIANLRQKLSEFEDLKMMAENLEVNG